MERFVVNEIKAMGGEAVANYDSVVEGEKLVKTAMDTWGRIDIIVNNAGILRDISFAKMKEKDWDFVNLVHLKGTYAVCKAAWPIMRQLKYGRIVNVTSTSGLYGNFGQANYAAAKMGMYGLARSISMEGGRSNITCNCVAPVGATTMNSGHWSDRDKEIRKAEYVAPLVAYLAHSSCEESGSFFETSAGSYKKLRWERTEGLNLFPAETPVTIDTIAENWQTITNFELTEHPQSMADSLQRMYARFDD